MSQGGPAQRPKGRAASNVAASKGIPEAPQPPPEQESRILLLTEKLKQQDEQVQAFKALEEKLIAETAGLREECRSIKRERLQVTTALQRAADTAAAEAAALRVHVHACNQRLEEREAECKRKEGELGEAASASQAVLKIRIAELEETVAGVEEFRQRRDELEAATKQAQQKNIDLTQSYEEKLGELHLRAHRLQQHVEQLEQEKKDQAAAAGASNESEAEPLRLLHQNRKLAASLRASGETNAALQEKIKECRREIATLKTELSLAKEVEDKAIQHSASWAKKAAAAQEEVAAMQTALHIATAARDEACASHQGIVSQVASLKKQLEVEQRQVKRQAQEVRHAQRALRDLLAERSEAQAFLVSSLRCIRREVAAQQDEVGIGGRRTARKVQRLPLQQLVVAAAPSSSSGCSTSCSTTTATPTSTASTGTSPALTSAPSCSGSSIGSSSSVRSSALAAAASVSERLQTAGGRLADVQELSWEEREAVLRLLLAQINGKTTLKAAQAVFTTPEAPFAAAAFPGEENEEEETLFPSFFSSEIECPLPEVGSPCVNITAETT